jgi:hypothetical protein
MMSEDIEPIAMLGTAIGTRIGGNIGMEEGRSAVDAPEYCDVAILI